MSTIFHELRDTLNGLYLLREETPRTRDLIMSSGERLSAILLCSALRSNGNDCQVCDTREIIITNGEHGKAKVDFEETNKRIKAYFSDDRLYVCTGFIASGKNERRPRWEEAVPIIPPPYLRRRLMRKGS